MASTNQSPFYQQAEVKYLNAQTDQDRLKYLEEMIKECPKHKSAEKMLANLKIRRKKLLEKLERSAKTKKGSSSKNAIKKHDLQGVLVGKANSGKSSLLKDLTNTNPFVSEFPFSTRNSQQGMLNYGGVLIQLVESPSIDSDYFDKGVVNTADTILLTITKIDDIQEIESKINNPTAKRIILFNKSDLLNENDKRKIASYLQSKKYNFILVSSESQEGYDELKKKLFSSFGKIRIFTKEPGKLKSNKPIILSPESTVHTVAEKILHGFSKQVSETRIWGPSSKFGGQKVGMNHVLKDLDIVEFKTR
ncbi:hypothetical protein COU57_03785 [Candidatus Pacearchaeota archaeon CG10_big_fil_rev_8_21_14_0_10_32_14]|nr:MAG: hypothetical protein COU57_03785 [Candidatus Pacearchaeota archaeon CG10_big_fil_rev_8_21_14_0_10_32_14]